MKLKLNMRTGLIAIVKRLFAYKNMNAFTIFLWFQKVNAFTLSEINSSFKQLEKNSLLTRKPNGMSLI